MMKRCRLSFGYAVSLLQLATLLSILLSSAAFAESPTPAPVEAKDAPVAVTPVVVGVYLNQVPMMSLRENRFQVDFYVWFRWKGDSVKPYESFEMANGKIESRQVVSKDVKAGENYVVLRCVATIMKFWDVQRFPFDNHTLELQIEDNNSEETILKFVADGENSAVSPEARVPGWKITPSGAAISSYTYHTNYGDVTLPKNSGSTYSRFVFSVPIVRDGHASYFKLFFSLYVAVLIAVLSLFILPNDSSPRLGFSIGAIFASTGANYVIANSIPVTSSLTIAEKINVLTVATVFIALVGSVTSVRRFKITSDLKASMRFDRFLVMTLLAFYFVGNVIVLCL